MFMMTKMTILKNQGGQITACGPIRCPRCRSDVTRDPYFYSNASNPFWSLPSFSLHRFSTNNVSKIA